MKNKDSRTKNVGIWIRVSTEDQAKGESPEHHEARAREYAKFNEWNVTEIYNLAGVSGKTIMDHPEAKRMLSDVKQGRITGLIFSKLARLARNTKELLEISDFFRQYQADIISINERIDTSSPAGRLFYTMIAAMAQWEREEIVERINSSISTRAKLGKSLGGPAPFGYMWKENKLVPHPEEAPIRKRMYELFLEHKRMKGVARHLNEAGYRTRKGARFTDTTVRRLLQDTTAKGLYRANHTYRDGKGNLLTKPESDWVFTPVERIVTDEVWNQCNSLVEKRKGNRRLGPKPVHLFAGLVFCGCGHKMYVFVRSPKYVCKKCHTKIPIEELEDTFRDELKRFFVSKDKVDDHLVKANGNIADKRNRIEAHKRQLEKVQGEMRRMLQLYHANQISVQGFGRIYQPLEDQERALSLELPKLLGELDALEMKHLSATEVISEATNLYHLWPKLDRGKKRQVIENLTEKVTVTREEIDITFTAAPSYEELTKQQRNLWPMMGADWGGMMTLKKIKEPFTLPARQD